MRTEAGVRAEQLVLARTQSLLQLQPLVYRRVRRAVLWDPGVRGFAVLGAGCWGVVVPGESAWHAAWTLVWGERSKHGLAGHKAIYLAAVSQTPSYVVLLPSTDVVGKCLFSLQGILVVSTLFPILLLECKSKFKSLRQKLLQGNSYSIH